MPVGMFRVALSFLAVQFLVVFGVVAIAAILSSLGVIQ